MVGESGRNPLRVVWERLGIVLPRNVVSIAGWILSLIAVFGLVNDVFGLVEFTRKAWEFLPRFWAFLLTDSGKLVLLVLGMTLTVLGNTVYRNRKPRRQRVIQDEEAEQLGRSLRTILRDDMIQPDKGLLVQPRRLLLEHLQHQIGPYLVFEFSLYNANVLSLAFDHPITGHLVFQGQELKDVPEFAPGSLPAQPRAALARRESWNIELRQFLLPEAAKRVSELLNTGNGITFVFSNLKIAMSTKGADGNPGPTWSLPLPGTVSFKLPASGGSVAFAS